MANLQKCTACGSLIEFDQNDPGQVAHCQKCGAFLSPKASAWNPYEAPSISFGEDAGRGGALEVPGSVFGKFGLALYLLGQNLGLFALISLTVDLPVNIAVEHFGLDAPAGQELSLIRLAQFLQGVFGPISTGALVFAIAKRMEGEKVGYFEAIGIGFQNWGRLFIANFVAGLFILLGCIAFLVPGIILMIRYALLAPVVILEHSKAPRQRSRNLTVGRGWSICGASLLFYVLWGGAAQALFYALGIAQERADWLNSVWIGVGVDCVTDTLTIVLTIVMVLFYLEGRHSESVKEPFPDGDFGFSTKMTEAL